VREEVEALEHHPDVGALPRPLSRRCLVQFGTMTLVPDGLAIHYGESIVGSLETVEASKERALPGSGRPDQADGLPSLDF